MLKRSKFKRFSASGRAGGVSGKFSDQIGLEFGLVSLGLAAAWLSGFERSKQEYDQLRAEFDLYFNGHMLGPLVRALCTLER